MSEKESPEKRAKRKVQEFLSEELSDHSLIEWSIERAEPYDDSFFFIYVHFSGESTGSQLNDVRFKYGGRELFVELGEEFFYEVNTYSFQVRHFWQALLWQY